MSTFHLIIICITIIWCSSDISFAITKRKNRNIRTLKRCKKETNTLLRRGRRIVKVDKDKMQELRYKKGYTLEQLAKYFNCGYTTIKNRLKEIEDERIN